MECAADWVTLSVLEGNQIDHDAAISNTLLSYLPAGREGRIVRA